MRFQKYHLHLKYLTNNNLPKSFSSRFTGYCKPIISCLTVIYLLRLHFFFLENIFPNQTCYSFQDNITYFQPSWLTVSILDSVKVFNVFNHVLKNAFYALLTLLFLIRENGRGFIW